MQESATAWWLCGRRCLLACVGGAAVEIQCDRSVDGWLAGLCVGVWSDVGVKMATTRVANHNTCDASQVDETVALLALPYRPLARIAENRTQRTRARARFCPMPASHSDDVAGRHTCSANQSTTTRTSPPTTQGCSRSTDRNAAGARSSCHLRDHRLLERPWLDCEQQQQQPGTPHPPSP